MLNITGLHFAADRDDIDKYPARSFPSNPIALDRAGLRALGVRNANSTILRWEKAGVFPARYRIGGCVFWDAEAVRDHLARLASEAGR